MLDGGQLQITACVSHNQLEISFKDSGNGISPDDLDLIFDPFYTTKKGGTGLGLAISQKIIQRHYGTITAQSVLGNGSVFTVLLPVHPLLSGFLAK